MTGSPVLPRAPRARALAAALMAGAALGACALPDAAPPAADPAREYQATPLGQAQRGAAETYAPSEVLDGLMARRGLLAAGPLAEVSHAVLDGQSQAGAAQLRAAVLRSAAKSQNWLPRLGPGVNITSLGAVVASLVLDQALVDHGARAAERAYARAEVEVVATALAEEANARVHEGLGLYLAAQKSLAQADTLAGADAEIARYLWIVEERVAAGVTDRAELQVVRQRRDQIAADIAHDRGEAASAQAELNAMAAYPLDHLAGLSPVAAPPQTAQALAVIKAEAEGRRATAEAEVIRAGYLPGISLGGDLADGAMGLTIGAPNGFGLGQGAAIAAAAAEAEAVALAVTRAEEASARAVAQLQGRLAALTRQAEDSRRLAAQAQDNYTLYAEQHRAGQRDVTDVVAVLDTRLRAERQAVGLDFDIVATRVAIAAKLGLLVDGGSL